jgi:Bax protein
VSTWGDFLGPRRHRRWRAVGLTLLVLIGLWILGRTTAPDRLPDFAAYERVDEKKAAFFDYLAPHVEAANAVILNDRTRLEKIRAKLKPGKEPGWFDRRWVHHQLEIYKFEPVEKIGGEDLRLLAQRMDIIPVSMVLAQAAVESAWGTSRFAREGNNLFGMRTYEPGTGIVPKRRPAGATWEVAAYDSVTTGIAAYVHNLNTHDPYLRMRLKRAQLRTREQPVTGTALVDGLRSYSEQGYEYVAKIRGMIRSNDLARYDQ